MDNLIQSSLNKIKQFAQTKLNNAVVALGQSPIGKAMVGAQNFIESPKPTQIVPQFQPFNNQNLAGKIGNFGVNIPGQMINTVIGRGIIDPSLDIANMAGRTLRGDQLPQYNQLKSPQVKLGYQTSNIIQRPNVQGYNPVVGFKETLANMAGAVEPLMMAQVPKVGGNILKEAASTKLLPTLSRGFQEGAKAGAKFGLVGGLQSAKDIKDNTEYLKKVGIDTGTGALMGGALGAGTSGLGYAKARIKGVPIPEEKMTYTEMRKKLGFAESRIEVPKVKTVNGKIKVKMEKANTAIPEVKVPEIKNPLDPEDQLIGALKTATTKRAEQEAIYTAERGTRFKAFKDIGKTTTGEAGAYKQLSALEGQMKKVEFDTLRKSLNQDIIDSLFEKGKVLNAPEQATYIDGLRNLLGEKGGVVPTEGQLKILSKVLKPETIQAMVEKRPLMEKVMAELTDALNIPRAIMATADLSAPGRQGIFLIGSKEYWKAFGSQIKYFFNEKAYKGGMEEITRRPNAPLYEQAKLAITDMGNNLATREESFMSTLVEKVPGLGTITKASNRAYSGFLNQLRADTFDRLLKGAQEQGINPETVIGDIAKFVNSATGRGSIGELNKMAPIINATFFSPRLMASRINLLNPLYYAKLNPYVRQEALKSLLTFVGTGMTVLGLSKLGGAEVGADPRSADFGKIKLGNTRYDIFGGFTQYIRLIAQELTGKLISTTTGKEYTLGEGYKPLTRSDILVRFMENKEAPVASLVTALMRGQNAMGQPLNIPVEAINRLVPMVVQDMYDIAKDKQSIATGVIMGIPGMFGIGSQTYGAQVPNIQTTPAGNATIKLSPVGGIGEDIVNKVTNTPESNIPVGQRQQLVNQIQAEQQAKVDQDKLKQQLEKGQVPQTTNTTNIDTAKLMLKYSPDTVKTVGNVVLYKDGDSIKKIDLSEQPKVPVLTGQTELDKKLLSTYSGEITSKINDITQLYKLGVLTAEQANGYISDLKTQQSKAKFSTSTSKSKKPKKVSIGKVSKAKTSTKKFKVKAIKSPKIKTLAKKTFKVKKTKQPKIKVKMPKI